MSDQLPAATGGDGALTYSLSAGGAARRPLLERRTRTISGTPTSATAAASYTLAATDTDGDAATLTFDLSVVTDPVVSGLGHHFQPGVGATPTPPARRSRWT